MTKIPGDTAARLDSGFARFFHLPDDNRRRRELAELMAACGVPTYSDLYLAGHDQERYDRLVSLDHDLLGELAAEPWFIFMNHGYAPSERELERFPALDREHEPWRHQAYLYCYLMDLASERLGRTLAGCDVLDVGCGRGGGLAVAKRCHGIRSGTGVDSNPRQVEFCIGRHWADRLNFVTGSAMDLPIETGSADVILNVESSHGYPDLPRFIAETERVLRPNGVLLLADNRESFGMKRLALEAALLGSRFSVVHREWITDRVLLACRADAMKFPTVFKTPKAGVLAGIAENSARVYASGAGVYVAYYLEKAW
jgi:SAM-dependent methyltransferase